MDIYWNAIATPLFLFVVANGLMALFRMTGAQRAPTESIYKVVSDLSKPNQRAFPKPATA